jgi:hypothetical protein
MRQGCLNNTLQHQVFTSTYGFKLIINPITASEWFKEDKPLWPDEAVRVESNTLGELV